MLSHYLQLVKTFLRLILFSKAIQQFPNECNHWCGAWCQLSCHSALLLVWFGTSRDTGKSETLMT